MMQVNLTAVTCRGCGHPLGKGVHTFAAGEEMECKTIGCPNRAYLCNGEEPRWTLAQLGAAYVAALKGGE